MSQPPFSGDKTRKQLPLAVRKKYKQWLHAELLLKRLALDAAEVAELDCIITIKEEEQRTA